VGEGGNVDLRDGARRERRRLKGLEDFEQGPPKFSFNRRDLAKTSRRIVKVQTP
jgi:hypothetical protein